MTGEHQRGHGDRPALLPGRRADADGPPRSHRPRLGAMSTSLLNDLLTDHLDKGYAEAAARRTRPGAPAEPSGPRARAVLAIGLVLVGFLLATAYRATAGQAPDSERTRQALVRDVERSTATSDALQRQAEALAAQLVRERDGALATSQTGDALAGQVSDLERATALRAVHGPGVTVLLGDGPTGQQIDPATGQRVAGSIDDAARLRDRDLQSVVNALWAAGAEAIAINSERLAAITTIREAGSAILVDLLPVASPYRIEAIGNPDTLLARFADSDAARRYQSYIGVYGIEFSVRRAGDLQLRAASGIDLRYASPMQPAAPVRSGAAGSGSPSGRTDSGASSGSPTASSQPTPIIPSPRETSSPPQPTPGALSPSAASPSPGA